MSTAKIAISKIFVGFLALLMMLAMTPAFAALTVAEVIDLKNAGFTTDEIAQLVAAGLGSEGSGSTGSTGSTSGSSSPTCGSGYVFTQTKRVGSRGEEVRMMQSTLNSNGYNTGIADGIFGNGTRAGVVAFQSAMGLGADGIAGPQTNAELNKLTGPCLTSGSGTGTTDPGTGTPVDTSGVVSVSLSPTTPPSTVLVTGQALADIAHFTFTNGTTHNQMITNVLFDKLGIASDTLAPEAYLFEGNMRLTDSGSLSDGTLSFNDPTGLFDIGPGASRTVAVKINVDSGATTGQTFGLGMSSFTAVNGGTSVIPVNLQGNIHTVSGGVTLASVAFNNTTNPTTSTVDAQENYRMWQNNVNIGNEDVIFKGINFRMRGAADNTDLTNLKFMVNGTQVGPTLPSFDNTGHAFFDLSSAPQTLMTGNNNFELFGDMTGQIADEDFIIEIREEVDVLAYDADLNIAVTPYEGTVGTWNKVQTGTISVNAGTLTITKTPESPSGTIVKDASNATLWEAEVVARGEAVKIESFAASITETDAANDLGSLDNGAFYVDGVQIGSSQSITETGSTTTYNFGSAFIAQPGVKHKVQFRADLQDSASNGVDTADVFQFILAAGTSNAELMSSGGTLSTVASSGNALTVGTGALTLGEDTSYGDRTVVPQVLNFKLADFNAQVNSVEGVTFTSIDVDCTGVGDADCSDDVTQMYVKIGDTQSSIRSIAADTNNIFSFSVPAGPGEIVPVEVWGDVASTATDGTPTDSLTMTVDITYSPVLSGGSTMTGTVMGQTISFGTGTLTASLDGASPLSRIVPSNQTLTAGEFLFDGTNDSYTLTELTFTVPSTAAASTISSAMLYVNGSMVGSSAAFIGTSATFTGLSIPVPLNGSESVQLKYMVNNIGTGAGTAGSDLVPTLDVSASEFLDGQGTESALNANAGVANTDVAANEMLAFKSIPTVTKTSTGESSNSPTGTKKLYAATVTADSAGDISLKQMVFNISWTDVGGGSTLEVGNFNFFKNGVDITDRVGIETQAGTDVESANAGETDTAIYVTWDDTQEATVSAGGSDTFMLEGTFSGFDTSGDTVNFQMVGDSALPTASHTFLNGTGTGTILGLHDSAAASGSGEVHNFLWSDRSANPHANNVNASSSGDWANGYKVLNFDLASESFQLSL